MLGFSNRFEYNATILDSLGKNYQYDFQTHLLECVFTFPSHIYEPTFVKATFSKSIIFKVKNTCEPNVFKWVTKNKFITSNTFAFLIINVKILSNFQKEWCTFGGKKNVWKKKDCSLSKFECFEQAKNIFDLSQAFGRVSFAINGKYFQKNMTIQTIMLPLWSFKHIKM